jgi:hypothetical protein
MLVAYRLAGLSALEGHYAMVRGRSQIRCGKGGIMPRAILLGRCWRKGARRSRRILSERRDRNAKGLIADGAVATCRNASREGSKPRQPA